MPEFTYEALGAAGQRNRGTLTANSEREVMAMLDARGLFPVTIAPLKSAAGHRWGGGGRKIRARYMSTFYSQLADLLRLRTVCNRDRQGNMHASAGTQRLLHVVSGFRLDADDFALW